MRANLKFYFRFLLLSFSKHFTNPEDDYFWVSAVADAADDESERDVLAQQNHKAFSAKQSFRNQLMWHSHNSTIRWRFQLKLFFYDLRKSNENLFSIWLLRNSIKGPLSHSHISTIASWLRVAGSFELLNGLWHVISGMLAAHFENISHSNFITFLSVTQKTG